ncbi:EscV/YscV/HrcV family type III secretion system export apparatus protein [Chitinasiproducens palmae]|uniref:Type III secretion protein V n=1 Tax=Chitinasiproducens palmae TaxID=1770053 RepID=A0A1H2PJ22_9BURK|nr:EscV/YscV/HrcV family type III secretion system export apparatus protein [Chitinasiproducens palmae]SDV46271.1 type III secretion protein V [Chitinasiproducens palmae]
MLNPSRPRLGPAAAGRAVASGTARQWLGAFGRNPELAVLAMMLAIVTMLVVPLPAHVLDLLVGLNIVTAVLIFMSAFYIVEILGFSAFPAVLLVTTLFRLSLSVSTSRLILLEGRGGHIIETFGRFVIGENVLVGFVIFMIVTVVQFIVITKGAERVAEVGARFSLDAMPGKQMSIDADLRAGTIDMETAVRRRASLERESQLYGSFDGAMKFVKGDAIASMIVIVVNLAGGVGVGVGQQGMRMADALHRYTLLSIGDGLVAQIPALLIAMAAGFVVTRVSDKGVTLGRSIVEEVFASRPGLLATAGVALGMGLVPGFPLPVFWTIALPLLWLWHRRRTPRGDPNRPDQASGAHAGAAPRRALDPADQPGPAPVVVRLPASVFAAEDWPARVERWHARLTDELGVSLPPFACQPSPHIEADRAELAIHEVPAGWSAVAFGCRRVLGAVDMVRGLDIPLRIVDEPSGGASIWVNDAQGERLRELGVSLRRADEVLYRDLCGVVARHIGELFGIQETKALLDRTERQYPDLVKETMRHMPVQRIAEVLQRLMREQVPIKHHKLVLETLAQWGAREKDVLTLVEHVRGALARYIAHRYTSDGMLNAIVFSGETEDIVRKGIRQTAGGTFLNLDPNEAAQLLDAVETAVEQSGFQAAEVVLITSVDIRRFARALIEPRLEALDVLSLGEIGDAGQVNVVCTV